MANKIKWQIHKWEGTPQCAEADYNNDGMIAYQCDRDGELVASFDSGEEAKKAFADYRSDFTAWGVVEYSLAEIEYDEDDDYVDSPGYDVSPFEQVKLLRDGHFVKFLEPGYDFEEEAYLEDFSCGNCPGDVYSIEDFDGKKLAEYTIPEEKEE